MFEKEQILMLVFICWQFVGIFWSKNTASSVSFSFLWLFMFLGFLFVSNLLDSKSALDRTLFAITLSGGIAGSIGIGQIILFHYGQIIAEPLNTMFNPFWGKLDVFLAKISVNYILSEKYVAM
ncbi:MAG: hypothetical protein GXZ02_00545, partial [Clostridiales bacterium]|nr:hypothetical protein [Clostridiales bacterium]